MIDNIEKIKELMEFRSEDDFYFLQIIKRKKEHPDMPKSVKVVHTFYTKSFEHLDNLYQEIKDICTYHKARAYIHVNRRSFKKCALQTLKHVTECIVNEDYKFSRKAFNTVCGRFSGETGNTKKWIVDIDSKLELTELNNYAKFINSIQPIGLKVYDFISTKNGWHIITEPFNVQQFKEKYPDIDKDNPTILYCP